VTPDAELFQRLQDRAEIHALIGQTENLHLDCKTWPAKDEDGQRILAKAFAGFANGDGGVVVVGLESKLAQKSDPDVITGEQPVTDAVAVKARIESLVGELVEPPLRGVRVAAVPEQAGSKAGFVVVHVPRSDGYPARSRKDGHFYIRVASGTFRMEYFQIADMFGKRHRPDLSLFLEASSIEIRQGRPVRVLTLGIENKGRAAAKFPSIRFKMPANLAVDPFGIDGNHGLNLPRRPTEPEWTMFGGGADHLIYPGTVLKITRMEQYLGRRSNNPATGTLEVGFFLELTLIAKLAADEFPEIEDSRTIPEGEWRR